MHKLCLNNFRYAICLNLCLQPNCYYVCLLVAHFPITQMWYQWYVDRLVSWLPFSACCILVFCSKESCARSNLKLKPMVILQYYHSLDDSIYIYIYLTAVKSDITSMWLVWTNQCAGLVPVRKINNNVHGLNMLFTGNREGVDRWWKEDWESSYWILFVIYAWTPKQTSKYCWYYFLYYETYC